MQVQLPQPTNRLISVISFYGKNEGLGSIPDLEAGCRITRYLFLLVYNSGVAQLVEQLAVNQEALIRFQSGSIPEAGAKSNR